MHRVVAHSTLRGLTHNGLLPFRVGLVIRDHVECLRPLVVGEQEVDLLEGEVGRLGVEEVDELCGD